MSWKLCFALLAVQLTCCLADSNGMSLSQLLMQMMEKGESSSSSEEMDPEDALEKYIKDHDLGDHDEHPLKKLLGHYLEEEEKALSYYKMKQAGDMITQAVLKEILKKDEVPEFAIKLMKDRIKASVKPSDDNESKLLLAFLIDYIRTHPKDDKVEMVMKLIHKVASKFDGMDQGVMRVMLMHMMMKAHGDEQEALSEIFEDFMSDDLGGDKMKTRDMYMLLLQHLSKYMPVPMQKKALSMLLIQGLGERTDAQARMILRKFITKLIIDDSKPHGPEEDDMWKYMIPGPCRVEERDGEEIASHDCPEDLECDVGPVTYRFNNRDINYYMCHYPDEYLEYFAFHACEVTYPNNVVEKRPNCLEGFCDFGSFTMTVDGMTYRAKFCSTYSNYTTDISDLDPRVLTACALEDPNSGMKVLQRKCPHDEICKGIPFMVKFGEYPLNAYMCQEKPEEEGDLAMKFMNLMLGFDADFDHNHDKYDFESNNPHGDDDDEEDEEEDKEEEHDDEEEEHSDEDFFNYIIMHLWEQLQKDSGERPEMDMEKESDMQDVEILKFLVKKSHDADPQIVQFLKVLEKKQELGMMNRVDRLFLNGIIRNLLREMNDRGSESDSRSGSKEDYMDDLREFLERHKEEHDDHAEEHKKMKEHLKELMDKVKSVEEGDSSPDSDEDEKEMNEQEFIKFVLKHLMKNEENEDDD